MDSISMASGRHSRNYGRRSLSTPLISILIMSPGLGTGNWIFMNGSGNRTRPGLWGYSCRWFCSDQTASVISRSFFSLLFFRLFPPPSHILFAAKFDCRWSKANALKNAKLNLPLRRLPQQVLSSKQHVLFLACSGEPFHEICWKCSNWPLVFLVFCFRLFVGVKNTLRLIWASKCVRISGEIPQDFQFWSALKIWEGERGLHCK